MDFFENLGNKLSQAGSDASNKIKKMQSINSLNGQISGLEKSNSALYGQLGRLFYENNAAEPPEQYRELINQINRQKQQIADLQEQLLLIKEIRICTRCGSEIKSDSAFCPVCGFRVAQPAPTEAAPMSGGASAVCSSCGAQMDGDSDFCPVCGSKVVRGEATVSVCPLCGKEYRPGTMFCTGCGYKLS